MLALMLMVMTMTVEDRIDCDIMVLGDAADRLVVLVQLSMLLWLVTTRVIGADDTDDERSLKV